MAELFEVLRVLAAICAGLLVSHYVILPLLRRFG